MLVISFVVSLQAIANAIQVTFSRIGADIYVETDPTNYAMFGQIMDESGVKIIRVNKLTQTHLTSRCKTGKTDINQVDEATLRTYKEIRERHLAEKRGPEESPQSYTWSQTFPINVKEYSVTKLDDITFVYSSKYFPGTLSKVIISGQVVVFVHNTGSVTLKTIKCLDANEEKLVEGIKKIDTKKKKLSFLSGERLLRKHLKSHPIDDFFIMEQNYT